MKHCLLSKGLHIESKLSQKKLLLVREQCFGKLWFFESAPLVKKPDLKFLCCFFSNGDYFFVCFEPRICISLWQHKRSASLREQVHAITYNLVTVISIMSSFFTVHHSSD